MNVTATQTQAGGVALAPAQIGSVSGGSSQSGSASVASGQSGSVSLTSLQIAGVEVIEQGPQGAPGNQTSVVAAVAIVAGFVVTPQADGTVIYHDATIASFISRPAWFATQSANPGGALIAQFGGEVTESSWTWTQDAPVFLGAQGRLTQTPPTAPSSAFMLVVGYATSPTSIYFSPQPPIAIIP